MNVNAITSYNATKEYPLIIQAPLVTDDCINQYYTLNSLNYSWSLDQGNISTYATVTNKEYISLDLSSASYKTLLNLTMNATGQYFSGAIIVNFTVYVEPAGMLAVIDGEDFQDLANGVTLSGQNSLDLDSGNTTNMTYSWACT